MIRYSKIDRGWRAEVWGMVRAVVVFSFSCDLRRFNYPSG